MKKILSSKKQIVLAIMLFALTMVGKNVSGCTAGFTWSQIAPDTIAFTNTSTGIVSDWQWDFGDGSFGNPPILSPIHNYTAPGSYPVCLYLIDSSGICDSYCGTVVVTGPVICTLSISAYEYSISSCDTCHDGIASIYISGGTQPITYSWNTSPIQTTGMARGLLPGTYVVCATDINNCTACDTVVIDTSYCRANFSWIQSSSNTITFTNASTGTNNSTLYFWDFGDGAGDNNLNPVHVYNIPGTYTVCLTIQGDTNFLNLPCQDTICQTIIVTGSIICTLSVTAGQIDFASCGTCADGSAYVNRIGGTWPISYLWNTTPIQTTQTAVGLLPGTYTVCVTDVNNCTACQSVTIDTSGCIANFIWAQQGNNTIGFTDQSTGNLNAYAYYWTFGDGTSLYNTINPVHHYNSNGTYTVCLFIADTAASCSDSICKSVTVAGVVCNVSIALSETNATCNHCSDGSASSTVTGGTGPYTYSWSSGQTTSSISGVAPGNYTLCVTDANGCTTCSSITVSYPPPACSAYFTLVADSIILHTYWATNYTTGIPPITYTWSWGDGTYSYTPYPTHTYASAGYYSICLSIQDSAGCTATYCDSGSYLLRSSYIIYVNVIPPTTTGIKENTSLKDVSVFPNPASNNVVISYSLGASMNLSIAAFDMYGVKIKNILDEAVRPGEHKLNWDITSLASGIYFLQINAGAQLISKKIVVIR